MDPITASMIMLGIGGAKALTGLGKGTIGFIQKARGKRQREKLLNKLESGEMSPPEYQYETPVSMEELSGLYQNYLAEQQGKEKMPGQDLIAQNIQQMAAGQIQNLRESARTSTQALGGTVDLSSQMIENLQQLEIQGATQAAQRELQATQMYGSALGQMGQMEAQGMEREWQRNEYAPWQLEEYLPWRTRIAQAQSDYAMGLKNISAGVEDLTTGLGYGAAGYFGMQGQGGGGGNSGNGFNVLDAFDMLNREMGSEESNRNPYT